MARHAGFGIAVSLRQATVNGVIRQGFDSAGPFYFPLPTVVQVGGQPVGLGGVARIAAPMLEFHANPANQVTAHYAFVTTLTARLGGGQPVRRTVRLDGTATLGLLLGPVGGRILLRVDPGTVSFAPLTATVLSGPPLPPWLQAALQSAALAAAAAAAAHQIPVLTVRDLGPAQLTSVTPGSFPETNFSEFDWFTVTLSVTRTVLRTFEGALTVGIDFAGLTQGDPAALTDLTRTHGGGQSYQVTYTPDSAPGSIPVLVGRPHGANSSIAAIVNNDLLAGIVGNQISPQVAGTPVHPKARLLGLSAGHRRFEKPLRGWEDGLWVQARAMSSYGVPVTVDVYLQPYLQLYEGTPPPGVPAYTPTWRLFVGRVDADFPWWADALIGFAEVLSFVVAFVVTLPGMIINMKLFEGTLGKWLNDILDVFNQIAPDNIANQVRVAVQGATVDAGLPDAAWITVIPDGIDMGFGAGGEDASLLPPVPTGGAAIAPVTWPAEDRHPIVTSVRLDGDLTDLARDALWATWEVRRKDTNEVVVTGAKPYNAPGGNGVSIPHHSEALYLVPAYAVYCRLTMTLGDQVGEIWSGRSDITVTDLLDGTETLTAGGAWLLRPGPSSGVARRHPFVEWGPRNVYFPSAWSAHRFEGRDADQALRFLAKTNPDAFVRLADEARAAGESLYWMRISRSRIHRTAVAARCLMLRQAIASWRDGAGNYRLMPLRLRDFLPFTWDNIAAHRHELCDYCFYGGPDKTTPRPIPDWYEPDTLLEDSGFEKVHIH
jgi:hypothetical protein